MIAYSFAKQKIITIRVEFFHFVVTKIKNAVGVD